MNPSGIGLAAIMVIALCLTPLASANDALLDALGPSREAPLASYEDARQAVSVFTRRPAFFSSAVQKWLDTGARLRATTSVVGGEHPLRDSLRWIEAYSGLVCRFQDDAVILDFPWNRPDERPPAVLLEQLLSAASPSMEQVSGDEWQRAFDALIATPENIDRAGNIRAEADSKRLFFPARSVDCMFAGMIRDEKGREFAIIVNRQKMQVSPGEGFASYYLFDRQGRFLSGGNFSTGWRCSEVTADLAEDGRTLRVLGLHNGTHPSGQDWALKDGRLAVVAGSTRGPGFSSAKSSAPPAIQTPKSFPSSSALRSFFFQPGPPTPSLSEVFRSL